MAVTNQHGLTEELPAVAFVEETGSTNDDVRALAHAGAPHGSAVAARSQTSGRGRRGHVWSSPKGGLYLSILLWPRVPMSYFVGIPAVCALGVLDALKNVGAEGLALKWPNDVILGENKLAGILVEAGSSSGVSPSSSGSSFAASSSQSASSAASFAVVGLGINIEPVAELNNKFGTPKSCGTSKPCAAASSHDAAASHGKATTEEPCSISPSPESALVRPLGIAYLTEAFSHPSDLPGHFELACELRNCIVSRVDAWTRDVSEGCAQAGPLAPILNEYFDELYMLGTPVRAFTPDEKCLAEGTFAGLDVWGRAYLTTEDGSEVVVSSEQASLRPWRLN